MAALEFGLPMSRFLQLTFLASFGSTIELASTTRADLLLAPLDSRLPWPRIRRSCWGRGWLVRAAGIELLGVLDGRKLLTIRSGETGNSTRSVRANVRLSALAPGVIVPDSARAARFPSLLVGVRVRAPWQTGATCRA